MSYATRDLHSFPTRRSSDLGSNTTGFTNFEASIGGKWLELVKELTPATKRVAMLYNPDTASGGAVGGVYLRSAEQAAHSRSEEHTSELQSLRHLVCRLLLEK